MPLLMSEATATTRAITATMPSRYNASVSVLLSVLSFEERLPMVAFAPLSPELRLEMVVVAELS